MTRPREGPDARSMSPSEAAAKKIADNTIEILRAERDRLFNTVAQQAAEIERLRAFEMAARDLNNDLTRIAKERDEMATQIKKLKEDLEQAEICIRARLDVIDQMRVENKELEDAHKRAGAKYAKIIRELRSSVYANIPGLKKQWDEVLAEGKIGNGDHIVETDQMIQNGKVWQITEERKAAIDRGMRFLAWSNANTNDPETELDLVVLRAMLEEAGL